MKRYLYIVWENIVLKTFNYKGKSNREEFIVCNIFWWIFLGLSALIGTSNLARESEFVEAIGTIILAVIIYLRVIPFTSLRVRRLHDIGETGSKLIILYIVAFIAPVGLGFIWLASHMYEKTLVTDSAGKIESLEPTEAIDTHSTTNAINDLEIEDVEL